MRKKALHIYSRKLDQFGFAHHILMVVVVILTAGLGYFTVSKIHAQSLADIADSCATTNVCPDSSSPYRWGLFQASNKLRYSLTRSNGKTFYAQGGIVYLSWSPQWQSGGGPSSVPVGEIVAAAKRHTKPYLELQTNTTSSASCGSPHASLPALASGRDKSALVAWGHTLASTKVPVFLTFDHEMNGGGYPWAESCKFSGADNANGPSTWAAAWNTVTQEVNQGAGSWSKNITWIFAPDVFYAKNHDDQNYAAYWKGNHGLKRVGALGLDGYLVNPLGRGSFDTYLDTFASKNPFGDPYKSLRDLDKSLPFYISETGVSRDNPHPAEQLSNLVSAAHADGNAKWIFYFDDDKNSRNSKGQRACTDLRENCWFMNSGMRDVFLSRFGDN